MCGNPYSLQRIGLSEDFGMENLREDLDGLNDTRTGSTKVSSGVSGPDFTSSNCRQIIPVFGQSRI